MLVYQYLFVVLLCRKSLKSVAMHYEASIVQYGHVVAGVPRSVEAYALGLEPGSQRAYTFVRSLLTISGLSVFQSAHYYWEDQGSHCDELRVLTSLFSTSMPD
jgi:hypothetical protein